MAWTKYFNPIKYYNRLKTLYYKFILRGPLIKSVTYNNTEIIFSITSQLELWRANSSFHREPLTVEWISDYINDGDTVIDIGANVGAYSLLIAKLKKKSIIYSIEPESANFHALNRNIYSNKLQERIIPICAGLGEKNTLNYFFLSKMEPGAALHGLEEPSSEGLNFTPKHVQGIVEYRLDDLIKELSHKDIDHLKIDVDGFEDRVIKGSMDFLNKSKCKTVLIELYPKTKKIVEEILHNSGFKEEKRNEWERPSGTTYNILYLKQ